MELAKVLAQLRLELSNLDVAILALERIEQRKVRRRGRPPGPLSRRKPTGREPDSRRPTAPGNKGVNDS